MNSEAVIISKATNSDLDEILALLSNLELPHDGVADFLDGFLVARDVGGRLVGCIGFEHHGAVGLLRSAAIATDVQRGGLGSRLTEALICDARERGIDEMTLLTTTAREFFGKRFGFEVVGRSDYDVVLRGSPEWNLPRCSSAVFMRLKLDR